MIIVCLHAKCLINFGDEALYSSMDKLAISLIFLNMTIILK